MSMNKSVIVQPFILVAFIITFYYFTLSDVVENTLVKMETSEGNVYLELYDDKAPLTVANFLAYTNEGFYNSTIFHRVISTFMIQGGGFDKNLTRLETKTPIKNEANIDLIKFKGWTVQHHFSDKEILAPDLDETLNQGFKRMRPFFDVMSDYLTTNLNGELIV